MKRRLLIAIWSLIPWLALAASDPKVDTFREIRLKTRGNAAITTITKAWADARPAVAGTAAEGNIGLQGATSTTLSWTAPQTVTVGQATTATTALDSQLLDAHDSTYFEPAITAGTTGQVWIGTKAWTASPTLTRLRATTGINATSLTLGLGTGTGKYLTTASDGTTSLVTLNQSKVAGLTTSDGPVFAGITVTTLTVNGRMAQTITDYSANTRPVIMDLNYITRPQSAPSVAQHYHGIDLYDYTYGTTTNGNCSLYTLETTAEHYANTPFNALVPIYGLANNSGTGTVNESTVLRAMNRNTGAGTITSAMGLSVQSAVNSGNGHITTNYGVKIENQTVGTTNYAIYTGTGKVHFGDDVTAVNVNSTGSVVTSGTLRSVGNVNSTGGTIQTNSATRIDNSGNVSAVNVNSTGNIVTSGTLRASGAATLTTTTLSGALNLPMLTAAPTTVTTGTIYITHAGVLKVYNGSAWKTYTPSD